MLSCCFRRLLVQLYACTEETTFISNSTWKSEKIPKPLNPRLMIRNPPRSVPFRSQVKSTPHVHVHANATQARAYVQTGIEQVKDRNASQNVHDKERGSCKESERRKRKWGRNRERIRGTGKRHFRGDRQRILRAKSLVSSPRARSCQNHRCPGKRRGDRTRYHIESSPLLDLLQLAVPGVTGSAPSDLGDSANHFAFHVCVF